MTKDKEIEILEMACRTLKDRNAQLEAENSKLRTQLRQALELQEGTDDNADIGCANL